MNHHSSGDTSVGDRLVPADDLATHLVQDGKPDAPALLLLSNAAAPAAIWDPVVPLLREDFRLIRLDLLGHGKTASRAGGYDVPSQARRVGTALDRLGVSRVTVVGHSSGCLVATALAEQRPDEVMALVLIDMGPSLDAKIPDRLAFRLILAPLAGRLLWQLRTDATIRKGVRASGGFSRPVEITDAFVEHARGMTHRDLVETMRASSKYLKERSLLDRLLPLGLPVLVVFGAEDRRWRSSSAATFQVVPGARVEMLPGVGHTPMMEDPQTTGKLLLEFALATARPK